MIGRLAQRSISMAGFLVLLLGACSSTGSGAIPTPPVSHDRQANCIVDLDFGGAFTGHSAYWGWGASLDDADFMSVIADIADAPTPTSVDILAFETGVPEWILVSEGTSAGDLNMLPAAQVSTKFMTDPSSAVTLDNRAATYHIKATDESGRTITVDGTAACPTKQLPRSS